MADLVLVGAGPVGSLLALTLARRGLNVDVYERRPDLRQSGSSAGRSINLAVSTRGLHALHEVGLDEEVLREAVPMLGRMTHAPDGTLALFPYGRSAAEFINSMSRGGLNKLLMTKAEESGRVRIRFQQRLDDYDFAGRTALFHDDALGKDHRVDAPVIIGTDGSGSALREAMQEQRGAQVRQEFLSSGYKELTIPALPGGGFALHREALHIWPRGQFMLIALPNRDGSFTCTLFLAFDGSPSFAELQGEAAVNAFFEEYFADALSLIPGLAAQFLAAPLGRMVTVRALPWAAGSALLLGDAAHAIVPFFGQGMNSGFEDVTLLAAALTGDWPRDFARFATARKPDADAIADLAIENFLEMRYKVADPDFLRLRDLEHQLQDRMPGRYLSRYQLVTFTRVPYRIALQAGKVQQEILTGLARGDYDFDRAERLVEERLTPLLA